MFLLTVIHFCPSNPVFYSAPRPNCQFLPDYPSNTLFTDGNLALSLSLCSLTSSLYSSLDPTCPFICSSSSPDWKQYISFPKIARPFTGLSICSFALFFKGEMELWRFFFSISFFWLRFWRLILRKTPS